MRISKVPDLYRKILFNGMKLLGSGFVASLFVVLISSNRVFSFSNEFSVLLLLVVQWEALGLTISKLGLDTYYFSQFKAYPFKVVNFKFVFLRTVVPSLLFCGLSVFLYEGILCLILFIAITSDVFSTVLISYFNAKEKFNVSVVANLLNYPLFSVLVLFFNLVVGIEGITFFIGLFAISSIFRVVFLGATYGIKMRSLPLSSRDYDVDVNTSLLGLQQLGNYYLFKGDQVILNIALQLPQFSFLTTAIKLNILFFVKLAELLNGLIVTLGPLYLDRIYRARKKMTYLVFPYILGSLIIVSLYFWAGGLLWRNDEPLDRFYCIPYILYSIFILPVNQISFVFMRENRIRELMNVLGKSICVGCVIIILTIVLKSVPLFLCLTAFHLISFVYFAKLKQDVEK